MVILQTKHWILTRRSPNQTRAFNTRLSSQTKQVFWLRRPPNQTNGLSSSNQQPNKSFSISLSHNQNKLLTSDILQQCLTLEPNTSQIKDLLSKSLKQK